MGPFSDLGTEHFKELVEASCPSCGTTLAIVSFPTEADVRHAARQGNKRAQEELKGVRRREAFVKRYAARELVRPDQLPDVEGAQLHFEWDSVRTGTNNEVVIRLLPDGPEIWREVEA